MKEQFTSGSLNRKTKIALQKGVIWGADPGMKKAAVKLRREFDIPDNGIQDPTEFIGWEKQHQEFDNNKFHERIQDVFLASRKFGLKAAAIKFLPGYVLHDVFNMTDFPLPLVREDLDNTGHPIYTMTYYEHTTKDEVVQAYLEFQQHVADQGKAPKAKKETLSTDARLNHAVRAMELRDKGSGYKEIADKLNDEFKDGRSYGEEDAKKLVTQYRDYKKKHGLSDQS